MADNSVVHMGENSPEQVAYRLMGLIARTEGYTLVGMGDAPPREWIIKTFAACLHAVKAPSYPEDAIALLPEKRG
ncbi:hypothetical protein FHS61_001466 [Altererythrobacter atlanticus]|uniref:Uncharacterized protein n=1 Tax=Croceibacterium atlanticum TaxID=1267766 RepID=A0A0F7KY53_9SPHN|nr:hypothetical protein [Croceibacterium atlanticum]AKH44147.1 hypothetical protein WYH_03128 [Croceibacterium atlanticum]MBB5732457.1 hypothetical protein [Croceibacterium atlanticum]